MKVRLTLFPLPLLIAMIGSGCCSPTTQDQAGPTEPRRIAFPDRDRGFMQFGQARIALGMTKAEVLQQIRLSQSQYRPLIDHESYEIFVQTPSPKEVESDRWTLICPARASPTVGGGSGIMLLVDFTDDVVVRIRELPWLAG